MSTYTRTTYPPTDAPTYAPRVEHHDDARSAASASTYEAIATELEASAYQWADDTTHTPDTYATEDYLDGTKH
jgi:hypothetical protein